MSIYNRKGEPISHDEWTALMADKSYRRVARTHTADGGFVSTVWLGLDHGFGLGHPKLIFETMKFPEQSHCRRYSTEEEALKGHEAVVNQTQTIEAPQKQ